MCVAGLGVESTVVAESALPLPDRPASTEALRRGLESADLADIAPHMVNDLEFPALNLRPDLAELFQRIGHVGVARILAGSGPTIAVLAADAEEADALADGFARRLPHLGVVRANGPAPGARIVQAG